MVRLGPTNLPFYSYIQNCYLFTFLMKVIVCILVSSQPVLSCRNQLLQNKTASHIQVCIIRNDLICNSGCCRYLQQSSALVQLSLMSTSFKWSHSSRLVKLGGWFVKSINIWKRYIIFVVYYFQCHCYRERCGLVKSSCCQRCCYY